MTKLLTKPEVARVLGTSYARVAYVIRTRGIAPFGRAGHADVFATDQLRQIKAALDDAEAYYHGSRPRRAQ